MENQKSVLAMLAVGALILGGILGYVIRGGSEASEVDTHEMAHVSSSNDKELELHLNMRKLWADHVIWTREYVVSAIDGTADVGQDAARLMKNQEEIGAAIVPYYGSEAGARLTELLKEHISIAVDLIAAAKTNDQTKFQEANNRWDKNGKDIAAFLSQANSNWPEQALAEAMDMHLKTTTDEAVARLNKDYEKDVVAFDAVFNHIMVMSDVISEGIIKQFPEKF